MKIQGRKLFEALKLEVEGQQKGWGRNGRSRESDVEYPDYSCWVDSDADDYDPEWFDVDEDSY